MQETTSNAGDMTSIPRLGRSPGVGNGNPLQYSCLGNPMDRGAWWATAHGVSKESNTPSQLNNNNSNDIYTDVQGQNMEAFWSNFKK